MWTASETVGWAGWYSKDVGEVGLPMPETEAQSCWEPKIKTANELSWWGVIGRDGYHPHESDDLKKGPLEGINWAIRRFPLNSCMLLSTIIRKDLSSSKRRDQSKRVVVLFLQCMVYSNSPIAMNQTWPLFLRVFFFWGGGLVGSLAITSQPTIYTLNPRTRPVFWSQKNGSSQPPTSWVLGIVESCDEMILRNLAKTKHQDNTCVAQNVAYSVFIKFIFYNLSPSMS